MPPPARRGEPPGRAKAAYDGEVRGARLARAWVIAVLGGCGPARDDDGGSATWPLDAVDRYAEARCDAMFRCPCATTGFVDVAMCRAEIHARWDDDAAALRDAAVEFDPACFERVLGYWASAAPCDDPAAAVPVPYCVLATGMAGGDEPCASIAGRAFAASSCPASQVCLADGGDGHCGTRATPSIRGLGEPCDGAAATCAEGLFCEAAAGTCAARAGLDAACSDAQPCELALWCDDTAGTCRVRAEAGEPCPAGAAWDTRPCAPDTVASPPASFTAYCIDGTCSGRVPGACGPWL